MFERIKISSPALLCVLVLSMLGLMSPSNADAAVVAVSGNVLPAAHGGATPWTGCDGVTANVRVVVNGAASQSTSCTVATGAFAFNVNLVAGGDIVTIWLDTNGGAKGSYTIRVADAVTSVTGLQLVVGEASMRANAGVLTNATLAAVDSAYDSDIPFTVGAGNLTSGTNGTYLTAGSFTPGGTVTTDHMEVDGTFDPAANSVTLTGTAGLVPSWSAGTIAGSLARFVYTSKSTVTAFVGIPSPRGTLGWIDITPQAGATGTIGYSMIATTNVANDLTIGDSTQQLLMTWDDITVGNDIVVNANSTVLDERESNGVTIVGGTMTGAGAVRLHAGTLRMRGATAATQVGPTAGVTPWQLYDVELENPGGALRTVTIPATGGGVQVDHTLTVGRATDAQPTLLDHEATDALIDATWNVVVTSKGQWNASSSRVLTIAGSFSDAGTFTANTGTVEFVDPTRTSTLSGATTFYNLLVDDAGKGIRLPSGVTTTVIGTTGANPGLTINGGSCATLNGLSSTTVGTAASLDVTGASSIQFTDIMDSLAVSALTATGSVDAGGNTSWATTGACTTVALSGTVTSDEAGTPWASCNGATMHVEIAWAGHGLRRVPCTAGTGAWTVNLPAGPDQTVIVYLGPGTTASRAVTTLRTPSPIVAHAGIVLTVDRYRVHAAGPTALTNAMHATWGTGESGGGVPITTDRTWEAQGSNDGWSWDATLAGAGRRLMVDSAATFSPDGDVHVDRVLVTGTLTGDDRFEVISTWDLIGTGTVSQVDARVELVPGAAGYTFGPSGANDWTLDDVWLLAPVTMTVVAAGATKITVTSTYVGPSSTLTLSDNHQFIAGSTNVWGTLNASNNASFGGLQVYPGGSFAATSANWIAASVGVAGTMTVGTGTVDTGPFQVNTGGTAWLQSSAITMDSVFVDCGGTLNGNTSWLHVESNFTRCASGTFTAGTSTVEFVSAGTSSIDANATTFYNLRIATASKTLSVASGSTITISGTTGAFPGFTAAGGGCTSKVRIQGSTTPNATINLTGNVSLQFVRLANLTRAGNPATATNSTDGGGNVGWTINKCSLTVTGNARVSEGGAGWGQCNGGTNNIMISVNGAAPVFTTCTAGTGAYTKAVNYNDESDIIAVFLNPTIAGDRGITYLRADSTVTGVEVTRNYARLRATASGAWSEAVIDTYDQDQDPDIPIRVTGATITTQGATELLIESGSVFDLSGSATLASIDIEGSIMYSGGSVVDGALVLTGSGTGPCSGGPGSQMPLCIGNAANDRVAASITFTGTGATTIPSGDGLRYQALSIAPTSGAPTYTLGTSDSAVLDIQDSLVIGNGTNAVTAQLLTGSPVLLRTGAKCYSGDTSCTDAAELQVTQNATFRNTSASGGVEAWGNVYGAGTVDFQNGTFTRHDFTMRDAGAIGFGPTGAADWTFATLVFDKCESTNNVLRLNAGGTGTLRVTTLLQVKGPTRLDAATNNRAIDIDGTLDLDPGSALDAPPTAPFTLADDATIDGTLNAGTGTITVDGAGTTSLALAANTTFYNLRIATPDKVVEFDPDQETIVAGTTGANPGFTVNGGACSDAVFLRSATAADAAPLRVTGTIDVNFANVSDMSALVSMNARNSIDSSGNTGWTIGSGMCSSITVTIPTGPNEAMSPAPLLAGSDGSAESTIHVVTDSYLGYQVTATDESDSWFLDTTGGNLPDFAVKEPSAPATWAVGDGGTGGRGGITVLSATGGRLARWGPGTSIATDFTNNQYLGLTASTPTLLHTAFGPTAGDDVTVGYRATISSSTVWGTHDGLMTFTVVATNP